MKEKKYELAKTLRDYGLSIRQIAKELYGDDSGPNCLKVNALLRYGEKRGSSKNIIAEADDGLYQIENYSEIDMSGGVRDTSEWSPAYEMDDYQWEYEQINKIRKSMGRKPISYHSYKVMQKRSMPREQQIEKDLEEVLWFYHEGLGLDEPVRSNTWGMVKYVNKHLAKVYGRRSGSANKPYPKLLAYIFTVYFLALHKYYPHIVHRVKRLAEEHLKTERNINRFINYVAKFLSEGSYLLLQQYL